MRTTAFLLLAGLLGGCGGLGSRFDAPPPATDASYPQPDAGPAPGETFTRRAQVLPDDLRGAPGWSITVEELGEHRYRLRMQLDALHSGGEGEVRSIVARTAEAFARAHGFAGYEILRLEEGVRSSLLWGSRVAEADFRLYQSAAWPSL